LPEPNRRVRPGRSSRSMGRRDASLKGNAMKFDQPNNCPFYLISRVTLQITSAMKKGLIEAGVEKVRPAYLGVLLCLWQEDERKVIDLGRCARLEPSTMTGLLDRMERDGLVFRAPDPNDRRAQRICLTVEGKLVKDPVMVVTPKIISSFFEGISDDELNQTIKILQRVLTNIEEESGQ